MGGHSVRIAPFSRGGAFSGTFLQPSPAMRDWTRDQWRELIDGLARYGISRIILQWSRGFALQPVFVAAQGHGMRVDLGLADSPDFWRDGPGSLDGLEAASLHQIEDAAPLTREPAFAGWYITQEIDDTRWERSEDSRRLIRYLKKLSQACRRVRRAPVSVSAFANGRTAPEDYTRFLARLRRKAHVDRILFQDSVGANKLTVDQAAAYHRALRISLRGAAEPIVEIFQLVREDPFEAQPAPIDRIRRQLQAVEAAGFASPMVFSLPEYQTPELFAEFGPNSQPR